MLWVNTTYATGCYESLRRGDGFYPPSQKESSTPFICSTWSDYGVHETVASSKQETDHAICHFALALLLNLKRFVCSNSINRLEDEQVFKLP